MSFGAGNADLATVHFDDHLDDGETEAQSVGAARSLLRNLVKAFKDALLLLQSNAVAGVAYL